MSIFPFNDFITLQLKKQRNDKFRFGFFRMYMFDLLKECPQRRILSKMTHFEFAIIFDLLKLFVADIALILKSKYARYR